MQSDIEGMTTQGSVEVGPFGMGIGIELPGPISMAEASCTDSTIKKKAASRERAIVRYCGGFARRFVAREKPGATAY
jgi:hypothetical protein